MQRRNSPSILLYSFGLALMLSLGFNGFLLYQQSRHLSHNEYEAGSAIYSIDRAVWQQQLAECQQANLRRESRITGSADSPAEANAQCATNQVNHQPEQPIQVRLLTPSKPTKVGHAAHHRDNKK